MLPSRIHGRQVQQINTGDPLIITVPPSSRETKVAFLGIQAKIERAWWGGFQWGLLFGGIAMMVLVAFLFYMGLKR